jgi:hypothetical protein
MLPKLDKLDNAHIVLAYQWIQTNPDSIESLVKDAVQVGHDGPTKIPIYLGRTQYGGELLPCKVIPQQRAAYVGYNMQEIKVLDFEVSNRSIVSIASSLLRHTPNYSVRNVAITIWILIRTMVLIRNIFQIFCVKHKKSEDRERGRSKSPKDSKERKRSKSPKESKEHKDSKSSKDSKEHKDSKSSKDSKEHKDSKSSKDSKEHKDSKSFKGSKDRERSKSPKDSKEHKRSKSPKESKEHKHSKNRFKWVSASNGDVPAGAFAIGRTAGGEALYLGRVEEQDSVIPGKVI